MVDKLVIMPDFEGHNSNSATIRLTDSLNVSQ